MKVLALSGTLGLILAAALLGCRSAAPAASPVQDQCFGITMAEIDAPPDHRLGRESVTNEAGTYRATILCEPLAGDAQGCQDRILVEDLAVGSARELRVDCFLPWRPFSELSWAEDNVLAFDQWASPTYGHHFEVDVEARQLLRALPIREGNGASPGS